MTKISTFVPDTEINGKDKLIGTDFNNAQKTKNFKVEDLGTHFNLVNGSRNFKYLFYNHLSISQAPVDGAFYANGNEQDPNNITHFFISKKTSNNKDVSSFFDSITAENPFDLIISQSTDLNTIFFFNISDVESINGYYKLTVSEVFFPQGKTLEFMSSNMVFNLKANSESIHNNLSGLNNGDYKHLTALEKTKFDNLPNTFITNHSQLSLNDGTNPHGTTKYDVDLGKADNTSDADKPVSNATQSALNGKANTIHSHVISDVNGLQTALNSKLDKVTTTDVEKVYIKNADGTQGMKPVSEFGTIKGTGTINRISKFTAGDTIGDSQIFDNGTNVGIGTTSPQARLDVRAQGVLDTDIVLRVRNSTDTKNFLVVNGAGDVYNNGRNGVNLNTFFGENVGRNATGYSNTAIGQSALQNNTTGYNNTAVGAGALLLNESGINNTAFGTLTLRKTTASNNTAFGSNALENNTTGGGNVGVGLWSLTNNTTGFYNSAFGFDTLANIVDSIYDIGIGMRAGNFISDGITALTKADYSIFIGNNTRANANNEINQIVIGSNAIGLGSNSVVLGNDSITRTQLRGQVIMGSFASAPTGIEGAIYYDSTTKKHYGFDGTTWNALY